MNWLTRVFGKSPAPSNLQPTTSANHATSTSPSSDSASSPYYRVYGLDLTPDKARTLTSEQACRQVPDLRVSDDGDRLCARKGEDFSVLLFFNKTGGVSQVAINAETTSRFLGVGMPQHEQVWSQLGYRLEEDSGQEKTWSNGEAMILARYRYPGSLIEVYYAPLKQTGQ